MVVVEVSVVVESVVVSVDDVSVGAGAGGASVAAAASSLIWNDLEVEVVVRAHLVQVADQRRLIVVLGHRGAELDDVGVVLRERGAGRFGGADLALGER